MKFLFGLSFLLMILCGCKQRVALEAVTSQHLLAHGRDTVPRMDTTKQNILLIGDSMAYSMMFRIKNYCDLNGHDFHVVSYVSATTKTYAECDTMRYFINLYQPTYIIFVIGANELYAKDVANRKMYVDKVAQQMCGIKSVWIGPPNWTEDGCINNVMMQRFGPKKFFLSKNLQFTRIPGDRVHPDRASGAMWVDSVARWIVEKSCYPIRLKRPEKSTVEHVDFVKLVAK